MSNEDAMCGSLLQHVRCASEWWHVRGESVVVQIDTESFSADFDEMILQLTRSDGGAMRALLSSFVMRLNSVD
jgi:hypothetical protein